MFHSDFSAEVGMKAAEVARQQEQRAQASPAPSLSVELLNDVGVRARNAIRGVKAEAAARGAAVEEARRPFCVGHLPLRGAILLWSVSHASELCSSVPPSTSNGCFFGDDTRSVAARRASCNRASARERATGLQTGACVSACPPPHMLHGAPAGHHRWSVALRLAGGRSALSLSV